VWSLYGWHSMLFLSDILTFVKRSIVKQKIVIYMEAQRLRRRGTRDPAYNPMMEAYLERMKTLNRRGRVAPVNVVVYVDSGSRRGASP